MITVKELISQCNKRDLCDHYIELCGDVPCDKYDKFIDKLLKFIDEILTIEPKESDDDIIISYISYDSFEKVKYHDTSVYSIKEIKEFFRFLPYFEELIYDNIELLTDEEILQIWNKHCQTLNRDIKEQGYSRPGNICGRAYYFCDRTEIMGYLVPKCVSESETASWTAASILYEISFFGFNEQDMLDERKKLDKAIRETKKIKEMSEEEKRNYYEDFDDFIKMLGEPIDGDDLEYDENTVIRDMITTHISIYRIVSEVYNELNDKLLSTT